MKTCFKCGEEKPLDSFYVHRQMKDGHLGKCKKCTIKDTAENQKGKPRKHYPRPEYEKMRASLPHRVEARRAYAKTEAGKEAGARCNKKWEENNADKKASQTILNNAVRSGRVLKPSECSICKKEGKIHGHHEDYAKPLEVIWCCPMCHCGIHKQKRSISLVSLV